MREYVFRPFAYVIWVQNIFKPTNPINHTDHYVILTFIYEDIDHVAKAPANPPPKKKFPYDEYFLR